MPTYAYACTVCDHRFDVQQSFTDDALTVCPECDGRLRKVFSAVGVVFKGSGFYRNDARGGSSTSSTSKPRESAAAASSTSAPASTSTSGGSSTGTTSSTGTPSTTSTSSAASAPAAG